MALEGEQCTNCSLGDTPTQLMAIMLDGLQNVEMTNQVFSQRERERLLAVWGSAYCIGPTNNERSEPMHI